MYTLKASYRFILFYLLRPLVSYGTYRHESMTRNYRGWYALPLIGCVAFVQADGQKQFRW